MNFFFVADAPWKRNLYEQRDLDFLLSFFFFFCIKYYTFGHNLIMCIIIFCARCICCAVKWWWTRRGKDEFSFILFMWRRRRKKNLLCATRVWYAKGVLVWWWNEICRNARECGTMKMMAFMENRRAKWVRAQCKIYCACGFCWWCAMCVLRTRVCVYATAG